MSVYPVSLGKRKMAKQVRRDKDFFAFLNHFEGQTGLRPNIESGHNEKVAPAGYTTPEYFNMVHTPVKNLECNTEGPCGRRRRSEETARQKGVALRQSKGVWQGQSRSH